MLFSRQTYILNDMTIAQMKSAILKNELSSRELVTRYLAAIEKSKNLNAIIEINPDAAAIAERLDSSKNKEGLLHGIPVLLKDNISTADNMHTSAGSVALAENIAPMDAPIVSALRRAGAVILGKANMTEFANYMSHKMPNGYSSRGGQTLNFFDHEADPSGSSSGSAVAVAADLCAAAVGTETCGSIISPAQQAGIVGLKPTLGLLSGEAIVPISFTLDTAGPMCRNVEDTALLLGVLAGKNYSPEAGTDLKGMRVGVCRNSLKEEYSPEWIAANEKLIPLMKSLGAVCVDLPDHAIDGEFFIPIMRNEFKYAINRYLRSMANNGIMPAIPRTLGEIIAYNRENAETALKYGQDILVTAEEKASGTMTESEYTEAMKTREAAACSLEAIFAENNLDIFFMTEGDFRIITTGFPGVTIPVGRTLKGLPVGSFFVARKFREDTLLRAAGAIERALGKI